LGVARDGFEEMALELVLEDEWGFSRERIL
jgi:hypothetical protein